jgi:hypothetical protein
MSGLMRGAPVLSEDGSVYCSPRCGYRCTKVAFDRATAEASALAARMGDGWTPCVWENGGWYYAVTRGCAKIAVDLARPINVISGEWAVEGYSAWLEPQTGVNSGPCAVQFIVHAETPEDALGFAVQDCRTHVLRLQSALRDLL